MGLSAREIARAIGYSPGTLYNIFENLDDVLLTLQTNMLSNLLDVINSVEPSADPADDIERIAEKVLEFAVNNRYMWNVLFTHSISANTKIPAALTENVTKIIDSVRTIIAKLIPGADPDEIDLASKSLLASIHGITAVAVTEKGPSLNPHTAQKFVKMLVTTYIRGLQSAR